MELLGLIHCCSFKGEINEENSVFVFEIQNSQEWTNTIHFWSKEIEIPCARSIQLLVQEINIYDIKGLPFDVCPSTHENLKNLVTECIQSLEIP